MIDQDPKEFRTAILRCRYLEERRREEQRHNQGWSWGKMEERARSIVRRTLRFYGWVADTTFSGVRTVGDIAGILPFCESVDIVCFDAFDTVLYRTVEPPDFLKRRSANYAAQLLSRRGFPVERELFLYMRAEEERRLRSQSTRRGFDSECKLSELIHATVKSLCGSEIAEEITEQLIDYEIEVECHHLRVAPGVKELLSGLRSRAIRTIVASDTYLEGAHLQYLLEKLGIGDCFDSIYTSADYSVGKYSNRLFQQILKQESVSPERVLHIGDNYESDVRGAVRSGIRAVFLRDVARLKQRRQLAKRTEVLSERIAVGPTMAAGKPNGGGEGFWAGDDRDLFLIGREVLGPVFCIFLLHVIEECHRWGVSGIYYLAREGFLLKRIHEVFERNIHRFQRTPSIPIHYLYVSRLATSLPSIRDFSERDLALASYRNSNGGLLDSLQTFGLNSSDIADLTSNLTKDDPCAVQKLFSDQRLGKRIRGLAEQERSKLRRYLAQEQFFNSKDTKALVDIGWSATIQANLTRAYYDDPEFPTVVGLYFGRRYAHEDDYALSPRSIFLPGFIFDERRYVKAEHAVDHCVELFEITASAPHGATFRYEEKGNIVAPMLGELPTALSREQATLQAGILECAHRFSVNYNDYEPDPLAVRNHAVQRMARLILQPKHHEVKALRGIRHTIDWGSKAERPLVADGLSPFSIVTPGHLIAVLRASCWPEGSLRFSGIPGGLLLLSLLSNILTSRQNLRRLARFTASLFHRPSQRGNNRWNVLPRQNDAKGH